MKESSSDLIMSKGMEHEDELRDRTRLMPPMRKSP